MKTPFRVVFLFTVCCLSSDQVLKAADLNWDGGGGIDTNFSTAANWDGDVLPTSVDNAYINGSVTIDSNKTVLRFEAGRWFGSSSVAHSAGMLATENFTVGLYGTGAYNLTGAASVSATNEAIIGHGSGNGTMNINTTGSASFGYVNIGHTSWGNADYPTGTVTVEAGTLSSQFGFWIGGSGGSGTLNLNGGSVISGGWVGVGVNPYSSENTTASGLVNQSGGSLTATHLSVGDAMGANGVYNLTGGNVNSSGELWVGQNGTAFFNQSAGTVSSNSWFVIGRDNGGNGTYNLTGGTVNAATTNGQTVLSSFVGGTSALNVSGGNFNATNELWVGEGGTGTLTVSATGVVTTGVTGYTKLGQGNGVGLLNLDGGRLTTGGVGKGNGSSAIFNFNGGILQAGQNNDSYLQGLTRVNMRDGGAVFDTQGFNVTVNQVLEHSDIDGDNENDGGLIKRGNGTLHLTAANTYTGTTIVEQGVLLVSNALGTSATGAGNVVVQNGGRLRGVGSLGLATSTQNITINSGGVVEIGNTEDISAENLHLSTSGTGVISLLGTLEFGIFDNLGGDNSAESNDQLFLAGDTAIILGGTLNVSDSTGFSNDEFIGWVLGDTWRLIDWSDVMAGTKYSGDFVFGEMPELADGLRWQSLMNDSGYHIQVAVIPEPGRALLLLTGGLCLAFRRRRSAPLPLTTSPSCHDGMKPHGASKHGPGSSMVSRSRSGMVLVLVLVIMSILMVLVLAMFSLGTVETRSSSAFSETAEARTLSDMPVSIVMGQIQQATAGLGMTKTWASQPGMIRVFGTQPGSGGGAAAQLRSATDSVWKLYSSDKMVEPGAGFIPANEAVSLQGWESARARFTDLNEPVVKLNASGSMDRIFPILSPEALPDAENKGGVGGFRISTTQAAPGGSEQQPVPMPVRWLYVLEDGGLAIPNGGEGDKVTFDPQLVTQDNPIIGRIAFWTDDESCKVNINTAGEGTSWDVPRTASWTDRNHAYFPPAQNEFQRYPGHPAMTSLSVILQGFDPRYQWRYPNIIHDGTVSNKPEYQAWLDRIYDLLPRIQMGDAGQGSRGGSEQVTSPNGLPIKRERLFVTVDEFFFGTDYEPTSGQRQPNLSAGAVDARDLETGRFFLTAHSRAPETNGFNRPRISLWPVQAQTDKRTAKDKLLAFCATVAGEEGYFQRASSWENDSNKQGSSQSPTEDFGLAQNQKVFGYLQALTKKGIPGFGTATFDEKYGALNRNQILLSMFDIVRWGVNASNPYTEPKYHYIPPRAYTGLNNAYLAEASAVPVIASGTSTEPFGAKLKAFGRYPTVIEACVVFMATDVEMDATTTPPRPRDQSPQDNRADKTTKMQAFLVLQPFTPVTGMPSYSPNVRFRIKGLENWKANGQPLGFAPAGINRSWVPAGQTFDVGHATAYTSMHAQFYRNPFNPKTVAAGGTGADETNSFPFVSQEVNVSTSEKFQFTGGPITVEIHLGAGSAGQLDDTTLIQTATLNFPTPSVQWPVPKLRWDSNHAPHSHWEDAIVYMKLQERLNRNDPQNYLLLLGDTVRSVVTDANNPAKGDFRVMCALNKITPDYYTKHADYDSDSKEEAQSLRHAGTAWTGHYGRGYETALIGSWFSPQGRQQSWQMAGYVINSPTKIDKPYGLLRDVPYWADCQPATPYRLDGAYNAIGSGRPGDWDTGIGRIEDGPYINKPDDTGITGNNSARNGYFARDGFTEENSGRTYAPNRQICSAVAFGSLPSGVHPIPANANKVSPWQTLLFCPNPPSRSRASTLDPIQTDHFGFKAPRDHLLLDLFWMPVVEPYAISEPLSTAGKINMNSQIMPFSYIERATGIHAALRSVRVSALPHEIAWAKDGTTLGVNGPQLEECYKSWEHWLKFDTVYEVNAEETMKGFHSRFNAGDIFRSASEICEIFLVPKKIEGRTYHPRVMNKADPTYENVVSWWNGSLNTQKDGMELTGDNVRESPYNQLYPRLTTRSNTFQVHYRVQALKKARSSAAAEWNEGTDALLAEQRGSALIERYVDPNDPSLPALMENTNSTEAIDDHYRLRIINKETFAP